MCVSTGAVSLAFDSYHLSVADVRWAEILFPLHGGAVMGASTVGVTRQMDKPLFCWTQGSLEAGLKAMVSVSGLRRCISLMESHVRCY